MKRFPLSSGSVADTGSITMATINIYEMMQFDAVRLIPFFAHVEWLHDVDGELSVAQMTKWKTQERRRKNSPRFQQERLLVVNCFAFYKMYY